MSDGSGPRVALVDADDEGHHRSFLNLYARLLAESGFDVVALSPFPLEDIPEPARPRVRHVVYPRPNHPGNGTGVVRAVDFWRATSGAVRDIGGIRLVLFMNARPEMKALSGRAVDVLFRWPWAVLEIHPLLEERARSLARRIRTRLLGTASAGERYLSSKYLRSVAFLNETAPATYKRYFPDKLFTWLPDASTSRVLRRRGTIATRIHEAARGRIIVTIAGALERRKGLYQMMYLAMNADPDRFFFAFCGKPYWASFPDGGQLFQTFVATSPDNCLFHLEFISDLGDDNEFDSVLQSSDIIYAAMQDYVHSSNVMTKAAGMRKPIIVTGTGVCGLRALKYRLGVVIPENDVFCALSGLDRLAASGHSGLWDEYQSDFSVSRLQHALVSFCERAMGVREPAPGP